MASSSPKRRATHANDGGAVREPIAILGLGKAGGSLVASARDARMSIVAKAARLPRLTRTLAWHSARTLFLAVPDDAIEDVARALARIAAKGKALPSLVVHMSGAKGASALGALVDRGCTVGTFHPLASLDGAHAIPRGTFIAIDTQGPKTREGARKLQAIAKRMKLVPGTVREDDRVRYHAGAVVAGNLATALLHEGVELLVRSGVARDVARVSLARLLASTAHNAIARPLADALTGPVARGDIATIAGHVALLDAEDASLAALYRALSLVLIDDVSAHTPTVRKRLRAALR
jgi:predicted short-subunit dehydrogenase-like oxidoreductase (DUF2520 family)